MSKNLHSVSTTAQNWSFDTDSNKIMSTNLYKQCPNCNRWFTKQQTFRHHIRACRRAMETKTSSGIATTSANHLLSIANTSLSKSSSTFKFDCDDGSSEIDVHTEVFDNNVTQFEDSETPNESFHVFQPSQRKRISVNNIDIMLHDLLLKHKASLLLYDKICNLFNRYIASPNFDRFAKLKTRKSLLWSTQKSMNTECLQPIDGIVQLHDKSLVTVLVFNTTSR